MANSLLHQFDNIDIYLFDQLLKGRFDGCKTVMDAGCGSGRNAYYFLKNGYEVYGVDASEAAIEAIQQLAGQLSPATPASNFVVSSIEDMPFSSPVFDLVVCSAVLHFAQSKAHFEAMLQRCWQIIKPGGFFFCRLASSIGMEATVEHVGNGVYLLPDGSQRFLVDEAALLHYTDRLGGQLFEPLKTTNVQGQRCMTTWCVQKQTA
jgi:tellurite methyltransferase